MSLICTDCQANSKLVPVEPGGRQNIGRFNIRNGKGLMVPGCGVVDVYLGRRASDADALSSRRSSSQ
jgi:hypothetical protein